MRWSRGRDGESARAGLYRRCRPSFLNLLSCFALRNAYSGRFLPIPVAELARCVALSLHHRCTAKQCANQTSIVGTIETTPQIVIS